MAHPYEIQQFSKLLRAQIHEEQPLFHHDFAVSLYDICEDALAMHPTPKGLPHPSYLQEAQAICSFTFFNAFEGMSSTGLPLSDEQTKDLIDRSSIYLNNWLKMRSILSLERYNLVTNLAYWAIPEELKRATLPPQQLKSSRPPIPPDVKAKTDIIQPKLTDTDLDPNLERTLQDWLLAFDAIHPSPTYMFPAILEEENIDIIVNFVFRNSAFTNISSGVSSVTPNSMRRVWRESVNNIKNLMILMDTLGSKPTNPES